VANGGYFLKVDTIDPSGTVTSLTRTVPVRRTLATVEILVLNASGEVVRRLLREPAPAAGGGDASMDLSTQVLQPGAPAGAGTPATLLIQAELPGGTFQASWDGTNDRGSYVTNGRYLVETNWTGEGGTRTVVGYVTVTGSAEGPGDGRVTARPNILEGGRTSTLLFLSSSQAFTLKAKLYNIAGELVRVEQGPTGTNQVSLNVTGLASGYYLAAVEIHGSRGMVDRQVVKFLIRR
jgi:hypothetical protein